MVYLIHFEQKYQHAQHYIGWSQNGHTFNRRIAHHQNGSGSKIMRAVSNAGIPWSVVRKWKHADGNFERKLHNMKNSKMLCPICNPESWKTHAKEITPNEQTAR